MKSPNLDYRRLSDHLIDRGLVDRETIQHVLQQCEATGALLPEILVSEGFVSDWELSRVCSELFHLPYLALECYPPSDEAREGLSVDYLRQYGLVPLDRFDDVVTVSMPGLVPSSVIQALMKESGAKLIPVVGSVTSNRRWIEDHMPVEESAASLEAFSAALPGDDESWANLFDDADEAVNLELGDDLGGDLGAELGGGPELGQDDAA